MPKPNKKKPKPKKRRSLTERNRRAVSSGPPSTSIGPSLAKRPEPADDPHTGGIGLFRDSEEVAASITALGRATDALVTRVVDSAREHSRDAAEHILDLSKAYYQEEGSGGQHSVQCDRCLLKSPGASSRKAAEKIALTNGWIVTDDYDHCPACKDGSKLLKSGSAALAVPPRLSTADMILVVRLRYIGDLVTRGVSLEAFLLNSARSGHRSMLSDLAQEFDYDPIAFSERISTFKLRNADLPEVLFESKGAVFMVALFAALKAEDKPTTEPHDPVPG